MTFFFDSSRFLAGRYHFHCLLINKTFAQPPDLQKALAFRLLSVRKQFGSNLSPSCQNAPVVAGMEPAFALHPGVWFCAVRPKLKMAANLSGFQFSGQTFSQNTFPRAQFQVRKCLRFRLTMQIADPHR